MTLTYGCLGSGVLAFLLAAKRFGWRTGGYVLANAVDHFATALAWMIWINCYAVEFYCRKNVPITREERDSWVDAFRPRALACLRIE